MKPLFRRRSHQWPIARRRSSSQRMQRRRSSNTSWDTEATYEAFLRTVAEERLATVPPSRWGVTKHQFIEFIEVVRVYQQKGLMQNIVPPLPSSNSNSNTSSTRHKPGMEIIEDHRVTLFSSTMTTTSAATSVASNSHYDDNKFNDPDIGPTIHQVNHQIVQQITKGGDPNLYQRIAGYYWDNLAAPEAVPNSSWALMKNPSGMEIDLFVSHAWSQGIYEFADHLLQEWPDDCDSAYICFLSNPQNLDTQSYMGTQTRTAGVNNGSGGNSNLQESAFYKVLRSSNMKQMVMLATPQIPIHKRAWCCLEAYIAMQRGLPVTIGGDRRYLSGIRDRVREFNNRKKEQQQQGAKPEDNIVRQVVVCLVSLAAVCLLPLVVVGVLIVATFVSCFWMPVILMEDNPSVAAPFKALYNLICSVWNGVVHLAHKLWQWTIACLYFVLFPVLYPLMFLINKSIGMGRKQAPASSSSVPKRRGAEGDRELCFAVDVRRAKASSERDRRAILGFMGGEAELVNRMLTKLILGQVQSYCGSSSVK